uniref:DNA replication licensing factor MCM7 n=1 Tax=Albugo laibachii Nc14 TaxID=890382 RepID=F0WHI2_9STRA|nr:conserved hypothetical protein [Albugo laibachii Nc14]|eukprot:CCA20701.1 conserved hypothetical protein [Albugo laibachii Nc14]
MNAAIPRASLDFGSNRQQQDSATRYLSNNSQVRSDPFTTSTSTTANNPSAGYQDDKAKCIRFLQTFTSHIDNSNTGPKYLPILQEVANRERISIPIALDDIQIFEGEDDALVYRIGNNTKRYISLFAEAVEECLPPPTRDLSETQDILDVLRMHRAEERNPSQTEDLDAANTRTANIPNALLRRFEIHLIPGIKLKPVAIRHVKARHVGALVRITGMVTRVSNVKPLLTVATYTCEICAFEVFQEVNARQFTPLSECPSDRCKTNRTHGRLVLQTKASKFEKFQELKFQETPDQVPMGHVPRSLTVYLRGELTRTCEPGSIVTICGVFLPLPISAQRQMQMGLLTETYLEATHVKNHKTRYSAMESNQVMETQVLHLQQNANLYEILSQSIAPEIYGHEDVKKALLLLMIGGVTKRMDEGMRLRGDINILLIGDPGVAKSQLLKHICTVAPRGIYTTGKGSSGVGLTAAVIRDSITREMTLEGGALVLADMGICAIDEFDKMEESDRTAIHEVMEQQTVSIAKAGITTTLNARTSVLAAANPIYGRYNPKLCASQNINLSNALLSRFDLIFLILDHANYDRDEMLARHVTHVHRFGKNPKMQFDPIRPEILRYFVAIAKQYKPHIPSELSGYIVEAYVTLRQQDAKDQMRENGNERNGNQGQTAMTARQLLSILRMSQALARLRFATEVMHQDVDEAIRLVYASKSSLLSQEEAFSRDGRGHAINGSGFIGSSDVMSAIYRLVLEYAKDRELYAVMISDIEPIIFRKGYTMQQLRACIKYYSELDVMQMNDAGTTIHFV